jgi:hypothetical protein
VVRCRRCLFLQPVKIDTGADFAGTVVGLIDSRSSVPKIAELNNVQLSANVGL